MGQAGGKPNLTCVGRTYTRTQCLVVVVMGEGWGCFSLPLNPIPAFCQPLPSTYTAHIILSCHHCSPRTMKACLMFLEGGGRS